MNFNKATWIKLFLLLSVGVLAFSPKFDVDLKSLAVQILPIHNFNEWAICSVFLFAGYVLQFLSVGAILEYTNPIPKSAERMRSMKKQIKAGVWALFYVIVCTTGWMWLIEPHTPYFGYYGTHAYTPFEFVKNLAIYMLVFDTWFYWTHRILHIPYLFKKIHWFHHQFVEPTAYGQDAVHPIEAIIQGPAGHFLPTLVAPMHPIAISVFGFLTSLYALLAHDGRAMDLNGHMNHHHYKECQFGLYWGLWDYICDTRYCKRLFPERYIPSWERAAGTADEKKNE